MKVFIAILLFGFHAAAAPEIYSTCRLGANYGEQTVEQILQAAETRKVRLCLDDNATYRSHELLEMAKARVELGFNTDTMGILKSDLIALGQVGQVYLDVTYQKYSYKELIELSQFVEWISVHSVAGYNVDQLSQVLRMYFDPVLVIDSSDLSVEDIEFLKAELPHLDVVYN